MNLTVTDVVVAILFGLVIAILTNPQEFGAWQARVELGFLEEADRLGLWGE